MMNWICQLRCKGKIVLAMLKRVATLAKVFSCFTSLHISNLSSIVKTILFHFLTAAVAIASSARKLECDH